MELVDVKRANARPKRRSGALLTAQEEGALARAWLDDGDVEARNALVNAFQPLAYRMAANYAKRVPQGNYEYAKQDMFSIAVLGLMKAADKFDPDLGFRFSTYAQWWVRAALTHHVIGEQSIVRMGSTNQQRRMFDNFKRALAEIERKNMNQGLDVSKDEQLEQVAEALGMPKNVVIEFSGRFSRGDVSLNAPMGSEDEDTSWIDQLASDDGTPEEDLLEDESRAGIEDLVHDALAVLGERERDIVIRRRLDPEKTWTLQELSEVYGISRERVRQLEAKALERIRRRIVAAGYTADKIFR